MCDKDCSLCDTSHHPIINTVFLAIFTKKRTAAERYFFPLFPIELAAIRVTLGCGTVTLRCAKWLKIDKNCHKKHLHKIVLLVLIGTKVTL